MAECKKIQIRVPADSYLRLRDVADTLYGGSMNAACVEVIYRGLESIQKSSWLEETVYHTVGVALQSELAEIRRLFAQDVIDAMWDVCQEVHAAHSTCRGILVSACERRSDPDFAYAQYDIAGTLISAGVAPEDALSKAEELMTSADPLEAELWNW